MFQFLDSTWAGYPYGKTSDPYQQAVDGLLYIKNRYGDPLGALAHENAYGWYDQGGWLPPGMTTVFNGTGRPELVLNPTQQDTLAKQLAANGGGTGQLFRDLNLYPQGNNVAQFADEVVYKLRVAARGGVWSTGGGA
jgi:hypothetical protein